MESVSPWVARWAPLVPPGEVLDLACGSGRHARHLAARGHAVLALDRDPAALHAVAGAGITAEQCDLEDGAPVAALTPARFAGIVVTNYLHRPLFAQLVASLAPDGILIYETFSVGNEAFGKPSNPAFLLAEGELLALAVTHGLHVIAYEDGRCDSPKAAMVQRLCACGPQFSRDQAHLAVSGA
ncbi:MAG: class I SAM-dependent methyltransferase [Massilia sp.]